MEPEIMIAFSSPPDRERLVVDLLVSEAEAKHHQFAEINAEADRISIEIYPRSDVGPWVFDPDELTSAIERGAAMLLDRLGPLSSGPEGN